MTAMRRAAATRPKKVPTNGGGLSGIGQGTYESTGKHQWRTESFMQISDGRRVRGEGEINLASRWWKGQLFEKS